MNTMQEPMVFIVHAAVSDQNIRHALGKAEYSYYFLLKAFLPALRSCGDVLTVSHPDREVDALYDQQVAAGKRCLFISFTPPNLAPVGRRCPTVCLFAWEFDTLPDGRWSSDPAQNWAWNLARQAGAIVCSRHTANVVQQALGTDYRVSSLAAPVWDNFAALHSPERMPGADGASLQLTVRGFVYDSAAVEFDVNNLFPALFQRVFHRPPAASPAAGIPPAPKEEEPDRHIELTGTIYTSVFNPVDGRKAWYDIVTAFCIAFRDTPDAVLLLKMTHTDADSYRHNLNHVLHQLTPFKCRVVAFNGYLEAEQFADLVRSTAFYVNASHCEGLCLPLLEFMSAGVPAIAPDHTAMNDYIRPANALVVASSEEINIWPNDDSNRYATRRYRNDWQSLRAAFEQAHRLVHTQPEQYHAMSECAHADMQSFCSLQSATDRLRAFLAQPLVQPSAQPATHHTDVEEESH